MDNNSQPPNSQNVNQADNLLGNQPTDNGAPMAPPQIQTDFSGPSGGLKTDEIITEIPLPAEAEDLDLIEKEWVHRAKQLVLHTIDDPHEQQRALSQMKADYLKKRYNKDIKVSED